MTLDLEPWDAKILLCIESSEKALTVHMIANITSLSASTVSIRSRNLADQNLIYRGKEGRRTLHFLTDEGREVLKKWKGSSDANYFLSVYEEEIKQKLQNSKPDLEF